MIRLTKSATKVVVVVAVEAVVIYMSATSGFRWCDPFVNVGSGVTAVALSCKW